MADVQYVIQATAYVVVGVLPAYLVTKAILVHQKMKRTHDT